MPFSAHLSEVPAPTGPAGDNGPLLSTSAEVLELIRAGTDLGLRTAHEAQLADAARLGHTVWPEDLCGYDEIVGSSGVEHASAIEVASGGGATALAASISGNTLGWSDFAAIDGEPTGRIRKVVFNLGRTVTNPGLPRELEIYNDWAGRYPGIRMWGNGPTGRLEPDEALAAMSKFDVGLIEHIAMQLPNVWEDYRLDPDEVPVRRDVVEIIDEFSHRSDLTVELMSRAPDDYAQGCLDRHGLSEVTVVQRGVANRHASSVLGRVAREAEIAPSQLLMIGDQIDDLRYASVNRTRAAAVTWSFTGRIIFEAALGMEPNVGTTDSGLAIVDTPEELYEHMLELTG